MAFLEKNESYQKGIPFQKNIGHVLFLKKDESYQKGIPFQKTIGDGFSREKRVLLEGDSLPENHGGWFF